MKRDKPCAVQADCSSEQRQLIKRKRAEQCFQNLSFSFPFPLWVVFASPLLPFPFSSICLFPVMLTEERREHEPPWLAIHSLPMLFCLSLSMLTTSSKTQRKDKKGKRNRPWRVAGAGNPRRPTMHLIFKLTSPPPRRKDPKRNTGREHEISRRLLRRCLVRTNCTFFSDPFGVIRLYL